ncbi:hypothetical protein [Stenotrophomonas panacihumi]|uniref:hypothetical protein n=1 Tax=Stenotrophomonas panacihumi TaxID=676599 RepID=UPI0011B24A5B|nr:hypothetical protein [Stenotrophomonas panacihumi]
MTDTAGSPTSIAANCSLRRLAWIEQAKTKTKIAAVRIRLEIATTFFMRPKALADPNRDAAST